MYCIVGIAMMQHRCNELKPFSLCAELACAYFQWHMYTNVDSVHNRTNLEKVTQVYFSLEKRASPWGSPEVSTPIQYTTAQDYVWL